MNRIVVALDASPRAAAVLAVAIDLARRTNAKLLLFRAVGVPPEVPAAAFGLAPENVVGLLNAAAAKGLTDMAATVPPELLDGIEVGVGSPWQAICAEGVKRDADLIIIGSHGYGALDRIVGTTAAKVVNHADRSVLVVRPHPSTNPT